MITSARIEQTLKPAGLAWITALRAPAIRQLATDDGPLQLSLFDSRDMAEISSPDYPGERLVVCKNSLLAEERRRHREDLLAATETDLARIKQRVERPKNPLSVRRPSARRMPRRTVRAYKSLAQVERAFRSLKTVDLALRPVFHWSAERVRAHVLLCMLAYYLEWHMRQQLAPLLFDDHDKPAAETERSSPVAKATVSEAARRKASTPRLEDEAGASQPVHSFRTLMADLATMTTNTVSFAGRTPIRVLTKPTAVQARVLALLGADLTAA